MNNKDCQMSSALIMICLLVWKKKLAWLFSIVYFSCFLLTKISLDLLATMLSKKLMFGGCNWYLLNIFFEVLFDWYLSLFWLKSFFFNGLMLIDVILLQQERCLSLCYALLQQSGWIWMSHRQRLLLIHLIGQW